MEVAGMFPTLVIASFCVSWIWTGVSCHPSRPAIPDDGYAAKIFSIAEAGGVMHADGFLSVEEMAAIFLKFDMNDNQCIDETEFIAHWTDMKLGELAQAVTLFRNADTDKDGCIEKVPDYSRLFYYFDRDADGKISEEEFKAVWYSLSA